MMAFLQQFTPSGLASPRFMPWLVTVSPGICPSVLQGAGHVYCSRDLQGQISVVRASSSISASSSNSQGAISRPAQQPAVPVVTSGDHVYITRYGQQHHAIVVDEETVICLLKGEDTDEAYICIKPLSAWLRGLRPVKVHHDEQNSRPVEDVLERALRLSQMPGMASMFESSEEFARFCKSTIVSPRMRGRMAHRVRNMGNAGSLPKALLVVVGWVVCSVAKAFVGRAVVEQEDAETREASRVLSVAMLAGCIALTLALLWQP